MTREEADAIMAEIERVGLGVEDLIISRAELDAECGNVLRDYLLVIEMRAKRCAEIMTWSAAYREVEELVELASDPDAERGAWRKRLEEYARHRILQRRRDARRRVGK